MEECLKRRLFQNAMRSCLSFSMAAELGADRDQSRRYRHERGIDLDSREREKRALRAFWRFRKSSAGELSSSEAKVSGYEIEKLAGAARESAWRTVDHTQRRADYQAHCSGERLVAGCTSAYVAACFWHPHAGRGCGFARNSGDAGPRTSGHDTTIHATLDTART